MVRIVHYIGLLEFGGSQSFVIGKLYRKIDRTKIQFDFVVFPNQKKDFYNEIIELGGGFLSHHSIMEGIILNL